LKRTLFVMATGHEDGQRSEIGRRASVTPFSMTLRRSLDRLRGIAFRRFGSSRDSPVNLRRADWRFLLPAPRSGAFDHVLLLGGAAGLESQLIDAGIAGQVSRRITKGRRADAVVILKDARVRLRDAAACVAKGGALYCEIDRRGILFLLRSVGRTRRTLQRAGLSTIRPYWVRPGFQNCAAYLPLDVPETFQWYLDTIFTAKTPLLRIREFFLRTLARLGSRALAAVVGRYVVVAVAGPPEQAAPSVLGHADLPDELQRPNLQPVVLTSGAPADLHRRVILLPFETGGAEPIAVLKLWRRPEGNAATDNEQRTLAAIRQSLCASGRGDVPRPLGLVRWCQLDVAIESYSPGRLIAATSARWGGSTTSKFDDLRLVAAGLAELHCGTEIRSLTWGRPEMQEWVEVPLSAYEKAFGVSGEEEELFAAVRHRSASLAGRRMPLVWSHRDLGLGNICRTADAITVLDWNAGRHGLPLADLLYFAMIWGAAAGFWRGAAGLLPFGAETRFGKDTPDTVSRCIRESIDLYMSRLRIDRDFLPLILVLHWVGRAVGRSERALAVARGDAGIGPKAGNPYLEYVHLLAERRRGLFSEFQPVPSGSPAGLPREISAAPDRSSR
jgi:aminoglycoside phosphotransferase (APT) family kinase protein